MSAKAWTKSTCSLGFDAQGDAAAELSMRQFPGPPRDIAQVADDGVGSDRRGAQESGHPFLIRCHRPVDVTIGTGRIDREKRPEQGTEDRVEERQATV